MGFKTSDVVIVEPEYCPEAIREWYSTPSKGGDKRAGRSELTLRAKKHLSALGWVFWYGHKGLRRELRYTSPAGKSFYSLKAACKSCIDDAELGFLAAQESSGFSGDSTCSLGSINVSASPDSLGSCSIKSGGSVVPELKIKKRKVEKLDEIRRRKPVKKMRKLRDEAEEINRTKRGRKEDELDDEEFVVKPRKGKSMKKLMKIRDQNKKANNQPLRSSNRLRCSKNRNSLNDDICSVCHYGGELVLCDGCPSAFHQSCLGFSDLPDEELWFCPSCQCGICGAGDSKAGRFINCEQCQHRFHVGCTERATADSEERWFCSTKCEQVFSSLQKLVGKEIDVGDGSLIWTLLKLPDQSDEGFKRIKSKLHLVLDAMHECFEPAKDPFTGRDLVEDVIFGRKSELKRINFPGFYTVILENQNEELISVATVRVFRDLAEVPLVATRLQFRKMGMCRILMDELEKQMLEIGVERLILPAVPSLLSTWTGRFGFSRMTDDERQRLLAYSLLDFQDTIMCHKVLIERPDSAKSSLTEEHSVSNKTILRKSSGNFE